MSICFSENAIQTIDLDECIGLSLATINSNYKLLQDENCYTFEELETISLNLTGLNAAYSALTALTQGRAKAGAVFDGTGVAVPSVYSSFNIARILRRSTGVFELSFTTPFVNTNYALIGTSQVSSTTTSNFSWVQPSTIFATTSATINIRDLSGTYVNPAYVSIAVYSL